MKIGDKYYRWSYQAKSKVETVVWQDKVFDCQMATLGNYYTTKGNCCSDTRMQDFMQRLCKAKGGKF